MHPKCHETIHLHRNCQIVASTHRTEPRRKRRTRKLRKVVVALQGQGFLQCSQNPEVEAASKFEVRRSIFEHSSCHASPRHVELMLENGLGCLRTSCAASDEVNGRFFATFNMTSRVMAPSRPPLALQPLSFSRK